MNGQLHNLFPTLVMTFDFSEHPLVQKTLDIIDSTKMENHALLENGVSSFDDYEHKRAILDLPELHQLNHDIQNCVHQFGLISGYMNIRLANSWFNIMHQGGIVRPHRHEGSVVSGAYYIRAPEGSSNLYFTSPLKIYRMFDIVNNSSVYSEYEQEIECKEGTLVLFPSWLEHGTRENYSDNRTVISFNTTYL